MGRGRVCVISSPFHLQGGRERTAFIVAGDIRQSVRMIMLKLLTHHLKLVVEIVSIKLDWLTAGTKYFFWNR